MRMEYSVEFALAMVVVMNVGIATLALFCAIRGNGQISEDTSKVVGGLGGGSKEDKVQESVPNMLQPVVKSVVGSLVPMRSNNSMIPVRTLPFLSHCSELEASTPRTMLRRELSGVFSGRAEKPVPRKSLASKFQGIVKAVGKIAAHLDDGKPGDGERGPSSKSNLSISHRRPANGRGSQLRLPPNDTEIVSSMYADVYPDLADEL
ncbi:hypothetical protein BSKO_07010 [Bryopsis sp. KO-2023]|nr:hypothetical protein BSKO_07010 [Bryopsis sp. KO-2023]